MFFFFLFYFKNSFNCRNNKQQRNNKYPSQLVCPFGEHLMKDAVMISCCGYFICCEECKSDRFFLINTHFTYSNENF